MTITTGDKTFSIRDYLTVIRRRWRWIVAAVAGALAIALLVSFTTTPMYQSTAQLTFVRQADIASAISGSSSGLSSTEVQLQSETYAELMTTDEMKRRASEELGRPVPDGVEITSEYVPDTSVLRITATSDDAKEAQDVVNSYAGSFTAWRKQVAVQQYQAAEQIVIDRIARYDTDPNKNSDPAYVQLVSRLQDIRVLEAAATGNFVLASSGALANEPILPDHQRDAIIGLLIGIVVSIGLVVLVEQLDIRVHSIDELGGYLGLPVLARLPRPARSSTREAALDVISDPIGPIAEAFRMFRGNLDFVDVDGDVSSIIFSSATQGEGKTTTLCNLAVTLARSGKRVVIADCDLRRPRVHRYFGLTNRLGVSTVVTGRAALADSLEEVAVSGAEGAGDSQVPGSLAVLTAGPVPPNPGEIVASRRLGEILEELRAHGDLVLIDAPPFLVVGDVAALARSAHGIIVVARLETVTKAMMKDSHEFLETLPVRRLGMVVTNVATEGSSYRYRYYADRKRDDADAEAGSAAKSRP